MNRDKLQRIIERCMIPLIGLIGIYFGIMLIIAIINFIKAL